MRALHNVVEGKQGGFDVPAGTPPSRLGPAIFENLALKGFAVCDLGLAADLRERALNDCMGISGSGRSYMPPAEISEGLLGQDGSQEIAELEAPDNDPDGQKDGAALRQLDEVMTTFFEKVQILLPQLGFAAPDRTPALLHKCGNTTPGLKEVDLTEDLARKWLGTFWWHRVMIIVFLGPDKGTLELEPYCADAEVHRISTEPGTMVVLRADLMSHSHSAIGYSYALSTFLLSESNGPKPTPTPTVKSLLKWITERLRFLAAQDEVDPNMSPALRRMMSNLFHRGKRTAVRSVVSRCASTWYADAWRAALAQGPDMATEIPVMRWSIDDTHEYDRRYSPDPDAWQYGLSNIKHTSFIDGLELFDNKSYSLSPNEARGMDPSQRFLLEISYEALINAGVTKRQSHASYSACYVGFCSGEWANCPKDEGINMGSGCVQCIYSNRISYCLGLKGSSITIDQEAPSGITGVHMGALATSPTWSDGLKKGGLISPHALCHASYLMLSHNLHVHQVATGMFNAVGRCLSFDASGGGLQRGEACAGACVRPLMQYSDGAQMMEKSDWPPAGVVAGSAISHSGHACGLHAPMGPSLQTLVHDTVREAGISPIDVEACCVHGEGAPLHDAVDITTALIALRSTAGSRGEEPVGLPLMSEKCNSGHCKEAAGTMAFVRAVILGQYGSIPANVHLKQMNPHAFAHGIEELGLITTEAINLTGRSSYISVIAHGVSGSNSSALVWNTADARLPLPKPMELDRTQIAFWPGGGGELEDNVTDCNEYHIVGTWTAWGTPEPMEPEGEGAFGFTVTLGESRFEQFQIWMDGEASRVLHPEEAKASKGSPVTGPDEDANVAGLRWMIDGRPSEWAEWYDDEITEIGEPGDQYRVHLFIAGKWRAVTWEKISTSPQEGRLALTNLAAKYYVTGDFNDWTLEEMAREMDVPGLFFLEVTLRRHGGQFQIIKDQDWFQVFYPSIAQAGLQNPGDVLGPDDSIESYSRTWCLEGKSGSVARIEFQRVYELGEDIRTVSWRWI